MQGIVLSSFWFSYSHSPRYQVVSMHNINTVIFNFCIRANILLDRAFNPKIADFGFSVEKPQKSGGRTVSCYLHCKKRGVLPSGGNIRDLRPRRCVLFGSGKCSCIHEIVYHMPINMWQSRVENVHYSIYTKIEFNAMHPAIVCAALDRERHCAHAR
jgi:hypothetical protein